METKTLTWYETTIRQDIDGKPTKRQFVVKAETFTEAATTTESIMGDDDDWEKVSITETKIECVYE